MADIRLNTEAIVAGHENVAITGNVPSHRACSHARFIAFSHIHDGRSNIGTFVHGIVLACSSPQSMGHIVCIYTKVKGLKPAPHAPTIFLDELAVGTRFSSNGVPTNVRALRGCGHGTRIG